MKVKKLIEVLKDYSDYTIVSDTSWKTEPITIGTIIADHENKKIILEEPGFKAKHKKWNKKMELVFDLEDNWEVLYHLDYKNDGEMES